MFPGNRPFGAESCVHKIKDGLNSSRVRRLQLTGIGNQRGERADGSMKGQQGQGSESVNEES